MTATKKLIAFHGKQEIKDFYVNRVRLHAELDEIVQGKYWENGRGCAVGCSIHGEDHRAYETELGIPTAIARLEDGIFEGLPIGEAKAFPLQFIEAVPVGADLSKIARQMCVFVLNQCRDYAFYDGKKAIDSVLSLLSRSLEGDEPTNDEWLSAARSAAESAARSARSAWSARSAVSAAESAVSARCAWSAAESAWSAWSAAWSAWPAMSAAEPADSAGYAARSDQKDELLRLLRAAPVVAQVALDCGINVWELPDLTADPGKYGVDK